MDIASIELSKVKMTTPHKGRITINADRLNGAAAGILLAKGIVMSSGKGGWLLSGVAGMWAGGLGSTVIFMLGCLLIETADTGRNGTKHSAYDYVILLVYALCGISVSAAVPTTALAVLSYIVDSALTAAAIVMCAGARKPSAIIAAVIAAAALRLGGGALFVAQLDTLKWRAALVNLSASLLAGRGISALKQTESWVSITAGVTAALLLNIII